MTIRPRSLSDTPRPLLPMSFLCSIAACFLRPFKVNGLDGTRCGGAHYLLPLCLVRGRVVPERFLPVQPEDSGGQEAALGIPLAPIEIDYDMEEGRCGRTRCLRSVSSGHLLFLSILFPPG
jgi:hypothetical protein